MSTCSTGFEWFSFEFVTNILSIRTIGAINLSYIELMSFKDHTLKVPVWKKFKVFLKDLEAESGKIRLGWTSHKMRIFYQLHGDHIAAILLV